MNWELSAGLVPVALCVAFGVAMVLIERHFARHKVALDTGAAERRMMIDAVAESGRVSLFEEFTTTNFAAHIEAVRRGKDPMVLYSAEMRDVVRQYKIDHSARQRRAKLKVVK